MELKNEVLNIMDQLKIIMQLNNEYQKEKGELEKEKREMHKVKNK